MSAKFESLPSGPSAALHAPVVPCKQDHDGKRLM